MKRLILINTLLIVIVIKVPIPIVETAKNEISQATEEVKQEVKQKVTSRNTNTKRKVITTSDRGIKMIKKYEGCKLKAYRLPNEKYYTIGYGHYGADVKAGQQITQEQAEKLLKSDLQRYEGYVRAKYKQLNLNQNEFDALVSFTFNCGKGNLNKLTNNRGKEEIANKMLNYTNSKSIKNKYGLQKRRLEEQKLFLGGNI